MLQANANVAWNKQLGPSYFKLGLICPKGFPESTPGQFIMLDLSNHFVPFLPRPFSIHGLIKKKSKPIGVEILYQVIGKGTFKLSALKAGETINLLGPLGKGFSVPPGVQRVFLVAGGIGVAPLVFLASHLKEIGTDLSNCAVFLGGRSREDLLCGDDFLSLGITVHPTTDDGSHGLKGFVTDLVKKTIKTGAPDIMYACGPPGMLRTVARIAKKDKVPCQISVESVMACGMGACLGCAVGKAPTSGHFLHACTDGPVFDTNELKLAEEI